MTETQARQCKLSITEVATFLQNHLDSNSDEHILLGIAGNPEKGTNDSLLRDYGNAGSCYPDPISTLSDSRQIGRLTS
jgi:hypothetical protein